MPPAQSLVVKKTDEEQNAYRGDFDEDFYGDDGFDETELDMEGFEIND